MWKALCTEEVCVCSMFAAVLGGFGATAVSHRLVLPRLRRSSMWTTMVTSWGRASWS